MDIDLDDFSSYGGPSASSASLIQQLQKAWVSERAAPDILPYETRLLETISTRLREQVLPPPPQSPACGKRSEGAVYDVTDGRYHGLRKNC
jgi:hypothetical protein